MRFQTIPILFTVTSILFLGDMAFTQTDPPAIDSSEGSVENSTVSFETLQQLYSISENTIPGYVSQPSIFHRLEYTCRLASTQKLVCRGLTLAEDVNDTAFDIEEYLVFKRDH